MALWALMRTGAEHIFHIALTQEWEDAKLVGEYRVSTLGATVEDVGYVHGSFRDQVERIGSSLCSNVSEPVIVLQIDPNRLSVPVRVENLEGGSEPFPHIYGPLAIDAVVATMPAQMDSQRFVVAWDDDR